MPRLSRRAAALIAIGATVLSTGLASGASADSLANAKARAAALTKTVNQLQTEAEVATERYDAIQARLNLAVAERGQADQALTAMQAKANAAQQTVADRARALYESGGDPTVLAALLSNGRPDPGAGPLPAGRRVLAYESKSARAAAQTLVQAHALDQHDAAISHQVTVLQVAQQADASKVLEPARQPAQGARRRQQHRAGDRARRPDRRGGRQRGGLPQRG